jgi:hypothetical protein
MFQRRCRQRRRPRPRQSPFCRRRYRQSCGPQARRRRPALFRRLGQNFAPTTMPNTSTSAPTTRYRQFQSPRPRRDVLYTFVHRMVPKRSQHTNTPTTSSFVHAEVVHLCPDDGADNVVAHYHAGDVHLCADDGVDKVAAHYHRRGPPLSRQRCR